MSNLIFSKGLLENIADPSTGYPYLAGAEVTFLNDVSPTKVSPNWCEGQLYLATKDSSADTSLVNYNGSDQKVEIGVHKMYMYLDGGNSVNPKRYVMTAPIEWTDILNKPQFNLSEETVGYDKKSKLQLKDGTEVNTQIELPFLHSNGDLLTGALYSNPSIALIGVNGGIGMRALAPTTVAFWEGGSRVFASLTNSPPGGHVGQFNISDSDDDTYGFFPRQERGKHHWGAQMSAYDEEKSTHNHIRISHVGLECQHNAENYIVFQDGDIIVDNKITLQHNTITNSLDFIFA